MNWNGRGAMAVMLLGWGALATGDAGAGVIPNLLWSKIHVPGPADTVYDVAVDDWGNSYVVTDQSASGGCHTIKYDAFGQFKWEDVWGGAPNFCSRIAIGPSNFVYVGGNNSADFQILRYSGGGALGWAHSWGGTLQDVLYDMVVAPDGGVVAVGEMESPSVGDLLDGGIVKYQFNGTKAFDFVYTPGNARFRAVDASAYGIVAVGEVNNIALTVMLWPNGALRWAIPSGAAGASARAVEMDANGAVVVTGADAAGNVRTWKYDVAGGLQWDKTFTVAAGYVGRDLALDAVGNAFVVASADSGTSKAYIVKYRASDGLELNWKDYDEAGADEYAREVRVDGLGRAWVGVEIDDAGTYIDRSSVIVYTPSVVQQWHNIRPDAGLAGIDLYGGYPHLAASAKSSSNEQWNVLIARYGKWKLDLGGADKWSWQAPSWFFPGGSGGGSNGNGNKNFFDDAVDFTSFHAHAGESYDLSATASGPALDGVGLTLLGSDGTPLATAGSVGGDTLLRWTAPVAGTYLLRFEPENGASGDDTDYAVALTGNMRVSSLFSRTIGNGTVESGHGLVQMQDGGLAVAGEVGGEMLLATVDALGDPMWARSYATSDGTHKVRDVVRARSGRLALAGEASLAGAASDALLAEVDPASGDVVAAWTFGGGGDDALTAVTPEPVQPSMPDDQSDQGYVVAGYTGSYGVGGSDGLVMRIVDDGGPAWITAFGGEQNERVAAIVQMPDDGLLAVGRVEDAGEGFVARLDLDGTLLWSRAFGAPGTTWGAEGVAALPDGGFVVTGYGPSPLGLPDDDLWVARFDAVGRARWQKMLVDAGDQRGLGVAELADGRLAVVGFTESSGTDRDGWLLLFDRDGGLVSQQALGGAGDDELQAVRSREGWGFAATGMRADAGGMTDAWLLAFDMDGALADGCALVSDTAAEVADSGPESHDAGFVGTSIADMPVPLALTVSTPHDAGVEECVLLEPGEVSPPGSAQPLRFTSQMDLEWEPLAGAESYDLYRGDVADMPMGRFGDAIAPGLVSARGTDDEMPVSGQAWGYVVRGANRLGSGPGGAGTSDGWRAFPPDPITP